MRSVARCRYFTDGWHVARLLAAPGELWVAGRGEWGERPNIESKIRFTGDWQPFTIRDFMTQLEAGVLTVDQVTEEFRHGRWMRVQLTDGTDVAVDDNDADWIRRQVIDRNTSRALVDAMAEGEWRLRRLEV
jgi:hypothetical protein